MPGSGKGEVAEVGKKRKLLVFGIGDTVREWFSKEMPGESASKMTEYAHEQKKKYDSGKETIWAKRLIQKLEKAELKNEKIIIIDGIRDPKDIETFKKKLNFRVVAVIASAKKRFERNSKRGRSDDSSDYQLFKKRDENELSWGSGEVIKNADYKIENEGTLEELDKKINLLLDKLEKETL